jgi:voltage-gated potassium channel
VLLGWQIRRILVATYPGLQAIEALALALAVLIVVFAYSYLSLSRANAGNFSEPLDHVTAVYFTVVTFGTVGFGDIVPRTDATRVLVTVQIVLDLVLLAGIARTIVFAAKLGARRRETERSQ